MDIKKINDTIQKGYEKAHGLNSDSVTIDFSRGREYNEERAGDFQWHFQLDVSPEQALYESKLKPKKQKDVPF